MKTPILSILIPTLPQREKMLDGLINELVAQTSAYPFQIEIIVDDRVKLTTGEKRNWLNSQALGEYVWHVDDDDMILPGAVDAIMDALKSKPDCLAINGYMTTDGKNKQLWDIRMGNPYETKMNVHYRFPNHITPMKREIARMVQFPNKSFGEDYEFAKELNDRKLLKTQEVVKIPVYHYRYITKK